MLDVARRVTQEREPNQPAPGGAASGAAPRSNLEIARSITLRPIAEIAAALGILDDELQPFGRHIAKIDSRRVWERVKDCPNGRYIDVTGITPTPLGEGKTLVTIGLSMALNTIGKRAIGTIRQPSTRTRLRDQGWRGRWRLQPGAPDGAAQPPSDRRQPCGRSGP